MTETIERLLYGILRFNPAVAWHELRLRMRVGRVFFALLAYVVLTSLAVALPVWFTVWEHSHYGYGDPPTALGRTGLHWLVYTEISLIFIAIPAYAASAIASERERQTLEMLRATMLTPGDVVSGKLLSVLAMAAVLLGVTVPVAAWCLLLGGVSPGEVLRVYLLMFATAAWIAGLGMVMSAHFTRALGAVVATYGTIVGGTVVTGISTWLLVALLMIPFTGTSTSPPVLGPAVSAVVVGVPVLVATWLAVLLIRWLVARVPIAAGFSRSRLAAVALMVVVFIVLMTTAMPLVERLAKSAPTALLLANPYGAAAATLEETVASELLLPTFTTSGAAPGTGNPQGSVWAAVMWLYAIAAAGLWALATRLYARRSRT